MHDAAGVGSTLPSTLVTSVTRIDTDGLIAVCNASAEQTLLGGGAVSQALTVRLQDAIKFGRISSTNVSQFKQAMHSGSGAFQLENGRTFVLHSVVHHGFTQLEWMDASSVVSAAARRDAMTGLLSRQGFLEVQAARRHFPTNSAVLRISLNAYGDVRDHLGQAIADHLVRRAADRVANRTDAASISLSHGGSGEFFLVVESELAEELSRDLLEIMGRPYLVDGRMINCTVSIGTAPTAHADDLESNLSNAGLALQRARSEGGNRIHAFTADMREALERKRAMELDLRKALALREFSLVYQPQLRIDRRELVGFEALIRWNKGGINVSPAEFVPLAEELGLIVPIGEWVLRTACRRATAWPKHISISVNVSPLQFRSPGIVPTVCSALESAGIEPSRLDLEVTEGALLTDSATVMEIFRQLKAVGVRFSMDDFGTGYSSLSYLHKFPFDKIKIDQSFVASLPDKDSRAIIRAVCALGRTLGMTTIAEGVETEEQLSQVEKKGCQQVQGYLTGRPLTPELADELAMATQKPEGSVDLE